MTFEEKVAKLRAFGFVEVSDWFPANRPAYRGAWLKREMTTDEAIGCAGDWMRLAIEVGGYLTYSNHGVRGICAQIQISRNLTADEIGDDPPCAIRAVRS